MIKFFISSCDPAQLSKNFLFNPFVNKYDIEIQFDKNRDKGLPERYNEFIDRNLNSDCWLVFIHDDVELLEDIGPKLEGLPKDIIYGACGAKKINGKGEIIGIIQVQDKRMHSGNKFWVGEEVNGYEIVPTFDPLFIMIHTSIYNNVPGYENWVYDLKFDEKLGYHLFSEELNINAKKNYGLNSAVLQIKCCHYSWGTKTPEYYQALEYIKQKHGIKRFIGTCDKDCMNDSESEDWE
jgi:hypothetical protein